MLSHIAGEPVPGANSPPSEEAPFGPIISAIKGDWNQNESKIFCKTFMYMSVYKHRGLCLYNIEGSILPLSSKRVVVEADFKSGKTEWQIYFKLTSIIPVHQLLFQ